MAISPGLRQLCFELDKFLEEEKQRARQVVHENVSGDLLAASFAAENAKQKLEDQERPEAEDLNRVTYLIDRAITDLVQAFTSKWAIAEQ
jgi:signal transduction histidine kinase